jgi:hypothetical protein
MRARAVVHLVPEAADVAGVLTDQDGRELAIDDRGEPVAGRRAADARLGLAMAHDPALGLDAHEHGIERVDPPEVRDVLPLGRDRDLQPCGLDLGDAHQAPPPGFCRLLTERAAAVSR